MEEGNRAMEGNTKLLRKKEPTKSGKEDTRQISRDQSLELAVQNRAIVKRVAGCLVSLSSLICLSFQTLICDAEAGCLQVTAAVDSFARWPLLGPTSRGH